ncbi:hypothetical protein R6Q57_011221 [Mikania cordata]
MRERKQVCDFTHLRREFLQISYLNVKAGSIEEVSLKKVLIMSASAKKLSTFKKQAGAYAALIMERLVPYHYGCIEMWQLETQLNSMATSKEVTMSFDDTADLAKTMIPEYYRNPWRKFMINVFEYGLKNWKAFWKLFIFLEINVALFFYGNSINIL